MRILVAPTIYVTKDKHLEWVNITIKYLEDSDIDFDLIGFVNALDDNYKEEVKGMFDKLLWNKRNNLSDSWNRAILYGEKKGYDYVVIPNLDIAVQPHTLRTMVEFADKEGGIMWSGYCTNNAYKPQNNFLTNSQTQNNYDSYALFMTNAKLFKEVGKFDNHFQAYAEDVDMEHRIQLAGLQHWCIYDAPFYHEGSVTLKGEPNAGLDSMTNGANQYFINKWGDSPRKQVWEHPFNDPSLDCTFIGDYQDVV